MYNVLYTFTVYTYSIHVQCLVLRCKFCCFCRLLLQCEAELTKVAMVWYEPLVAIMFSKYAKVKCICR